MDDTTETGLPSVVAIAWGLQHTPQRGPSRGLSHERIVSAAIDIADAEGLAAVTMQAVAEALGFTTMSLYRYVSSKEELLHLMRDAAIRLPEAIDPPTDWKAALKHWAQLIRDAYHAHPWVLDIPAVQISVLMPNGVRGADVGITALKELDIADTTKVGVILVISQYVAAMVELERSLADQGDVTTRFEGMESLSDVITEERFPSIAALVAQGIYTPTTSSSKNADDAGPETDTEFHLGLDLIIAGLETLENDPSTKNESPGG